MAQHDQQKGFHFYPKKNYCMCHGNDDATASIGRYTPIKLRLNSENANLFYLPHSLAHKNAPCFYFIPTFTNKRKIILHSFCCQKMKNTFFAAFFSLFHGFFLTREIFESFDHL